MFVVMCVQSGEFPDEKSTVVVRGVFVVMCVQPGEFPGEKSTVVVRGMFVVMCVQPGEFPGLLPLIEQYLDSVDDCDVDTSCTILQYLNLIRFRASGQYVCNMVGRN